MSAAQKDRTIRGQLMLALRAIRQHDQAEGTPRELVSCELSTFDAFDAQCVDDMSPRLVWLELDEAAFHRAERSFVYARGSIERARESRMQRIAAGLGVPR